MYNTEHIPICLLYTSALAYINAEIATFVEPALINTVLCSVLVFCFFNFRKKAKCFAGDVGSVSIAFILDVYKRQDIYGVVLALCLANLSGAVINTIQFYKIVGGLSIRY